MPRLYPTGLAFVNGAPVAEVDVDDETADTLLAYHPPVYTLKPPDVPADPTARPAAGPLDSTEEN